MPKRTWSVILQRSLFNNSANNPFLLSLTFGKNERGNEYIRVKNNSHFFRYLSRSASVRMPFSFALWLQ